MHLEKLIVILAVLLFFGLGIAILVIMDLSAKIPGKFQRDLFSIAGMRRDHPVEAFLTMTILLGIILALLGSLLAALMGQFGLFGKKEEPKLLATLGEERMVEKMRHFHNAPEQHFTELGKKPVCFYCHGDYPHSKKPMIRTMMNMHTQFIGCMTCHADENKLPEKDYRFEWLNYSGIPVKGVPFGTSLNPNTGQLIETDDYYSKIVTYTKNDAGEDTLLEMTEDKKDVQEFLAVRAKLSEQDREAIKKRFHKLVRPKGRKCSVCHTEETKSYLPFRQLGFSEQRIVDITHLPFIGMIEKYNEFYMPNLLNRDNATPADDEPGDTKAKTHETR
jgi:hypothetical protein